MNPIKKKIHLFFLIFSLHKIFLDPVGQREKKTKRSTHVVYLKFLNNHELILGVILIIEIYFHTIS